MPLPPVSLVLSHGTQSDPWRFDEPHSTDDWEQEFMDAARPIHKKIAVVVPKYGLVGGGERFASEVTERLAQNENYEIHVFANKWIAKSGRIKFHKVPIVRFPRFLGPLVFAWFVQWKISRMNFDLVHTHHWIFHADIYSAHGVPHAGWVRDVRNRRPSLYDRAVSYIERCLMRDGASSRFLPVSSIAMEAFRHKYKALPGQWQIIHPGVDVARFSSPDRNACRAEIRGRYGIGADDLLILFVGMNFEVKGLDTIIAALANARAAQPGANASLLVVGRGDEGKYRKMAQALGIADAVTFAGTQVDGLERYYRAADVFIMLSKFDTFGMVVLEAMAAGLPVIVSPNVGAKDLVEEGVNGFILDAPDNADAAASHIARLSDTAQREAMGAAAAKTAAIHDWGRLAKKMEWMYEYIFLEKSQKTQPKRVLVITPNRIGDVLLSTPLIRSLRRAWPEASIGALVFAGTEGVLASNPDLDEIVTIERRPAFFRHLRFLQGLWRGYDLSLSLMTSDRSTLYACVAGKHCVGLVDANGRHPWKKWLLSESLQFDNTNTHTVLMHLQLADALGVPRCHEVVAGWRAEDDSAVRKVLPFDCEAQPYAVLHVYPMYIYKAWRQEAWLELANCLNAQGIRVVLTGGDNAGEIAYVRDLLDLLPRDTVNVAGKLSLTGVACLLSRARVYIGPDTSVTHIAAAVGTPTIALFGPSNPVKWGPWPMGYDKNSNPYGMHGTQRVNNVVIVQGNCDYMPCLEEGCERHTASLSECLQNLPAASAIVALRKLLDLPHQRGHITRDEKQ